jgi:DnaJ like chaperone protein
MTLLIFTFIYECRFYSGTGYRDHIYDYPAWVTVLLYGVLVGWIPFLIYYQKRKFDLKSVENGVFKSDLPYSRTTLFEANLCLAIAMIKLDKVDVGAKLQHLRTFFRENYPENYLLFNDRLAEFYNGKHIKVSSIATWLDVHVTSYAAKYHIISFLASISMVDGEIIDNEYNLLKELSALLKLKESDLDSILSTYKYFENKKKQEEDQKRNNQKEYTYSSSLLDIAYAALGLVKGATLNEVKSAYRKLAMIHHPDKFANESEAQQKTAHERFLKINDAYEFVLKSFGL